MEGSRKSHWRVCMRERGGERGSQNLMLYIPGQGDNKPQAYVQANTGEQ